METIKEILHHTVEQLNENEAKQLLEYAGRLYNKDNGENINISHPAIKLPESNEAYAGVVPIFMTGISASEQLNNDRK